MRRVSFAQYPALGDRHGDCLVDGALDHSRMAQAEFVDGDPAHRHPMSNRRTSSRSRLAVFSPHTAIYAKRAEPGGVALPWQVRVCAVVGPTTRLQQG